MSKQKVVIAEATGFAGGTNAVTAEAIELAMGQAMLDMNAAGICDDTPPERVEELLGPDYAGKDGSTVIREAKIAARAKVKADAAAAEAAAAADAAE